MSEKNTQLNLSLVKSLQIVENLAAAKGTMRLQDLSAEAKIPVSTVSRILNTFSEKGYIFQDPNTLQYGLTHKFSELSASSNFEEMLIRCGHPVITELCKSSGETCTLIVEAGSQIIHLDTIEPADKLLTVRIQTGMTVPIYCTAAGKLFLAGKTHKQLEEYIKETEFTPMTPNTITDGKILTEELYQIREQGWAIEDEEVELGAWTVAAGITDDSGKILAAVSISGPVSRISSKKIPTLCLMASEAAQKISNRIISGA